MSFDLTGKSVAIIGMARTGLAVAEVVTARGGRATIFDAKPAESISNAIESANKLGVDTAVGCDNPDLSGFDLVVTSPGVPPDKMGLPNARQAGVEIIAEVELAFRIAVAPIAAITGTNGKTTTTVLAGLILREAVFDTYIAGNAAGTGLVQDERTIMPLVMAAHRALPNDRIVAEISSFQLEGIAGFAPKVGAVLNVTSDHLDRYSSVAQYADAKSRMFEFQGPDDYSIVNIDDPVSSMFRNNTNGHLLEFSRTREVAEGAYLRGNDIVITLGGRDAVVCARNEIRLKGTHNVENLMAAGLIAMTLGASANDVKQIARTFGGVAHRMEFVAEIDGVEYINNSMCTNVDAAVRSIESVDSEVVVICGGRDKNLDYTALADVFVRKVKSVVLIGEAKNTLNEYCVRAGYTSVLEAGSMSDAIGKARALANAGDVVLLAPVCSSFDMYGSFEERGEDFRQAVKSLSVGEPG